MEGTKQRVGIELGGLFLIRKIKAEFFLQHEWIISLALKQKVVIALVWGPSGIESFS